MHHNIWVTDSAAKHFKNMIENVGAQGVRLTIKKTGCSGYSYETSLVKEKMADDFLVPLENGISLLIDTQWLSLFNGLTIDFIEEKKNGIKQKHLVFNNPKESGRCGCGESFHLDE